MPSFSFIEADLAKRQLLIGVLGGILKVFSLLVTYSPYFLASLGFVSFFLAPLGFGHFLLLHQDHVYIANFGYMFMLLHLLSQNPIIKFLKVSRTFKSPLREITYF